MCLKNLCNQDHDSDYLTIWMNWSKPSPKYEKKKCKEHWKSFKCENKKTLKIGSLKKWANEDNPKKYDEIIKSKGITDLIGKNKEKFPDNDLIIETIIQNDKCHYIGLKDTYCPMFQDEHSESDLYLEINPTELTMKCHKCVGKTYPCSHIGLNKTDMVQLFNAKNLQINNYFGNAYDSEKHIKFEIIKLFDDNELNDLIFKSLSCTDFAIAKLLYYLNKHKYFYGEDCKWYGFVQHRWKKYKNINFSLRRLISEQLIEYYMKMIEYYSEKHMTKHIVEIEKLMNLLENSGKKTTILAELTEIYSTNNEDGFVENKLDSNPYLIGFDNGIFDLEKNEFRKGKPEDFVSMSVKYDYCDKYSKNRNKILLFFEDIMPEKSNREVLLIYLSYCLLGINKNEKFMIFTGGMRNGKSTLSKLLELTFGDYYSEIQNNLLTNDRGKPGIASPELCELIKKRIVISSESEGNQKINSGIIKGATGNDNIRCRSLFSNEIMKYRPFFKLILLCNDIPEVDKPNDEAYWKRLWSLYFPTTFVDNPKENNEKK